MGATTEHGCLSDFSNDGRALAIVAPGGGADAATLPDDPNCRPQDPSGRNVFQETFVGGSARVFGFPSGYEGTSMAAPHVSAAAALVIASGVLGPHPSPDGSSPRASRRRRATSVRPGTWVTTGPGSSMPAPRPRRAAPSPSRRPRPPAPTPTPVP